ncbi:MAG: hypothetical protein JW891_10375 [Candidatus Lokiarchaeota archaeon]|nr:hypothetical protein [Candidatus Lokiarchaeota archaeon]
MNIEEALIMLEGFQDALQEIVRNVDDMAFKSDVYMFSVYHLKKVVEKYKQFTESKIYKPREVRVL